MKMQPENDVTVSIITPVYNSERYIMEALQSVMNQTFTNWELIVVDDMSTDNTCRIVLEVCKKDPRVRLIKLKTHEGPSVARQEATKLAKGRFIAFLDSDDIWMKEKLKEQIDFMLLGNHAISCTAYEQINEVGERNGRILRPPYRANYNRVLLDCPIGNSTVVYDTEKLGKCYGPNIKNREDYALWLKILKRENYIWGYPQILTQYRIRKKSLSRNKIKLVYYHWILYRDFEHLSITKSLLHICIWGIIKLLKIK